MAYPDHFVENSEKDERWISQYIKEAYHESCKLYASGFFRSRDKFHMIKKYMMGQQSVSKYRRIIDPLGQKDSDKAWLNIDWSIIPIVPKFKRMAVEILNKKDFTLQAETVDPLANEDRERYYKQKAANITLKEGLEKNGMSDKVAVLGMKKEDPQDFDELDMHMEYGYRHQYAIEMEMALDLTMNHHNDWEHIREKVNEDLFDYGTACVKEDFRPNGTIGIDKVDMKEIIVGYSKLEDFSDARHIGEVKQKTIHQIRKEDLDNEISIEYLKEIAEQNIGNHGNSMDYDDSNYLDYRVSVVDLEFVTTNKMTLEKRKNKTGNTVVGKAGKKKSKKNEYSSSTYEAIYCGKWIVGTDHFYQCKMKTDLKRQKNNLGKTSFSYHIIAPGLYNMQTFSLAEQLISIADQIQIAWYKLQNTILRAKPQGIAIEITALENVPLGSGGQKLKPLEILDLYQQRGDLVFRAIDEEGQPFPFKPIEELKNGLGDDARNYFGVIQNYMQMIRDILGFNEVTDGSSLDPKQLVGVSKLQTQATNNSLAFLSRGERKLVQNMANDLTLRIHDRIERGDEIKGYVQALGKTTTQFFKASKNMTRYQFGTRIVENPSTEEKARLDLRINEAIKSNQITIADAVFIENFKNINLAEQMLAYRVKKNMEQSQQRAERQIQLNGQEQQKSAMVAEEEKRKTLQMQAQLEAQNIQLKIQGELAIADKNGQYRLREAQIIANRELVEATHNNDSREFIESSKLLQKQNESKEKEKIID
jgi:hypothetical protein